MLRCNHAPSSPRPPLFERYLEAMDDPTNRNELTRWMTLAIGALAIAGAFALLLAFSRIPDIQDFFPWPLNFFKKGLVVHVVFSFVVFFLCVFAAIAHLATVRISGGAPRFRPLGYLAFRGAVVAFIFLFVPALMNRGQPTLNNYIPVITDPLYYMALGVLGVAMALMAIRLLLNIPAPSRAATHRFDVLNLAAIAAAVFFLFAMAYVLWAWKNLAGNPTSHQFNEELFWGGGHILQFVNTALLIGAWYALGATALRRAPVCPMVAIAALAWLTLAVMGSLGFYLAFDMFSGGQIMAFTRLQYALGPAPAVVALFGLISLRKHRRAGEKLPWRDPGFLCLALSPLVFAMGGVFGLFVDGADTRTPGHYHAIIAGLTLAFIGMFYSVFLPLLGRRPKAGKLLFATIWCFFIGQSTAAVGLFIAGDYGTARKVAGAAQDLSALAAKIGMGLNGAGGLLAVIGGALFVWLVGSSLILRPERT